MTDTPPPPQPTDSFAPRPLHLVGAGLLVLVIAGFVWHWTPAEEQDDKRECTAADLADAHTALGKFSHEESEMQGAQLWPLLERAIHDYHHCDEPPISGEFSTTTCELLGHHWTEAGEVSRAARKHAFVNRFLAMHIDGTCDEALLLAIAQQAEKKCPRYGKAFCQTVEAAAKAALAAAGKTEK
ncbi:MAG: hypothetical protein JST92_25260 [Deltaproteobacteria bacterium]|nr:hypothetical protein [Deltaproteobacteria bacterium]